MVAVSSSTRCVTEENMGSVKLTASCNEVVAIEVHHEPRRTQHHWKWLLIKSRLSGHRRRVVLNDEFKDIGVELQNAIDGYSNVCWNRYARHVKPVKHRNKGAWHLVLFCDFLGPVFIQRECASTSEVLLLALRTLAR
jgi:hypothetical protein